jgi:hypothetical protein
VRRPDLPGFDETLQLAQRALTPPFVVVRDADAAHALGARLVDAPSEATGAGAMLLLQPTRWGALIPQLVALYDALSPRGRAIVSDAVWQTAPTPELAKAFAPPFGVEKLRPVEGYEMQLDHAELSIVERVPFKRDAWLAHLAKDDPRRGAVEADARGALRAYAWVVRREG